MDLSPLCAAALMFPNDELPTKRRQNKIQPHSFAQALSCARRVGSEVNEAELRLF